MPFNKHVSSWLYIHQWHYYSQKSFHFAQLRHSIPTKQQFPIYCFPTRWQRVCVCTPLYVAGNQTFGTEHLPLH